MPTKRLLLEQYVVSVRYEGLQSILIAIILTDNRDDNSSLNLSR